MKQYSKKNHTKRCFFFVSQSCSVGEKELICNKNDTNNQLRVVAVLCYNGFIR